MDPADSVNSQLPRCTLKPDLQLRHCGLLPRRTHAVRTVYFFSYRTIHNHLTITQEDGFDVEPSAWVVVRPALLRVAMSCLSWGEPCSFRITISFWKCVLVFD